MTETKATVTKNISVLNVFDKKSVKGMPYWSIETLEGNITCWDRELASDIKARCINKVIEAEIEMTGNFKNLKGGFRIVGDVVKEENLADKNAKLRRLTDCVLAANQAFIAGLITKEEITMHASGLANLIDQLSRLDVKSDVQNQ